MYDFVLFENFHLAHNHYKDICLIAKMLIASGYSVAIADVFDEANSCKVEGVEHLTLKTAKPSIRKSGNIPVLRVLQNYIQLWKIWRYLTNAVKEINPICCNIYAGSYHVGLSLSMMKAVPPEKNIFFWGLRSYRLYEYKIKKDGTSFNCFLLSRYVKKHNNVKFFVSDEMIRDEFVQLGFDRKRLVIRPERIISELSQSACYTPKGCLSLLSIGSLRPQKRIERILAAIKKIENKPVFYTIAGKADSKYENIIQEAMTGMNNVNRRNYRLSEEEYNHLMDACDYLILCDKKTSSNVTNGTMNEALLKGKPIIAPNYDPYKSIIEKYGVGLLYDDQDLMSLSSAIDTAYKMGSECFYKRILDYQKTLLFSNVVAHFKEDVALCING